MSTDPEAKRKLREERIALRKRLNDSRKARHKLWRKCFWTRPFRHEFEWSNKDQRRQCISCERPLIRERGD